MDEPTTEVPTRWVYEVAASLAAANIIGQRSCNPGDHLNYASHQRLIEEGFALVGIKTVYTIGTIPCSSCGEQVLDDDNNAHVGTGRIMCNEGEGPVV